MVILCINADERMICPKCGSDQNPGDYECHRCGIIFDKYHKIQSRKTQFAAENYKEDTGIIDILFYAKENLNPVIWIGQCFLLVIVVFLGIRYMRFSIESNQIAGTFFHLVNLPFHEAGHIFFRPFGRIVTSLGGSLMQLLMPLICMVVLVFKTRDPFGGSITLWWFGENFLDMAPYINDARSLSLPLLGGNFGYSSPYGFHDWEFILKELGLIQFDHLLANLSFTAGSFIMITAYIWATIILFKQKKTLLRTKERS